jgi:hypothetical protein
MPCKYLLQGRVAYCMASQDLLVPSLFELSAFCNGQHHDCLIYQQKEKIFSFPREESQEHADEERYAENG